MAESAAQRTPNVDAAIAPGNSANDGEGSRIRLAGALLWCWLTLSAVLVGFLLVGTIRVSAGSWAGWRLSLTRIWSRFAEYLATQGASPGTVLAVTIVMLVAIAGSIVLLYLAFGLRDAPAEPLVDDRDLS